MRPVNLIPPEDRRGDSAPTRTGAFACSSALITRIYDTTINNYLGLTTGPTPTAHQHAAAAA